MKRYNIIKCVIHGWQQEISLSSGYHRVPTENMKNEKEKQVVNSLNLKVKDNYLP